MAVSYRWPNKLVFFLLLFLFLPLLAGGRGAFLPSLFFPAGRWFGTRFPDYGRWFATAPRRLGRLGPFPQRDLTAAPDESRSAGPGAAIPGGLS